MYLLLAITCLFTGKVSAFGAANMGFSEYRVLVSKENKSAHLTLFNKGDEASKCEIGLTHYKYSKDNLLQKVDSPEQAFQPANKLLRYSPRRVIIDPRSSQKVRLTLRRKANQADGEFISYLNMKCSIEVEVAVTGQMGAIISYNIPVHVRIGDLAASTELELLSINPLAKEQGNGYEVTIRQYRRGNRSIIGNFEVQDLSSGKTIEKKTGLGLYQPSEYMDHKFVIANKPSKGLEIIYTESEEYGDGVVEKLRIKATDF